MERACRRHNVVRLSPVLLVAAVVVLGLVSAADVRASNLVGNPGFESPLAGAQYEGTVSPNFGNWIAYGFRHSIPLPAEVHAPNPVHGGSASGEIINPAGVGSALFVQDVQSFDPNSTYTLSGWVYPVTGEQDLSLEFGWDRGSAGQTTGGSGLNITSTATGFSAWQQSGPAAPALAYGAWHHLQLVVNSATLTSELYVDGSCQGISPAGRLVPGGSPSTILIGDGSAPPSESQFYWDEVELTSGVQVSGCPGGSTNGLVGEWQGNGNANDSIGTDNGVLLGGAYGPGNSGRQAFELDGATSYVEIPATAMRAVTGPISVAADVYPERISPGEEIFSQYDTHDTSTTFSLSVQAGGTVQWEVVGSGCDSLRGDARTIETTSPVLTQDAWNHVAATFEPSTQTLQILVNGSPVPTKLTDGATVPSLCVSATPLRIGAGEQFYGGLAGFYQGKVQDVQLYNRDITLTGGGSSGPLPCAATSSSVTLTNLSAKICRLLNDESTIVQQQEILLGVVGSFPRVSLTGVNMYSATPIATVPGSEAATTQAAMRLMDEALNDFRQEVADAVVDKIAEAYPDTVQAVHDLGSAEEEDLNAATEQLKAAKAIVDSVNGLTAVSLTEIAYHTASATLHLLKKLEAWQKALEKFKTALENSQAATQEQLELEAMLAQYIKAVSGETTAVSSAMSQIALVPQRGYDVFPGLPVNEFYPGSGATVVVNPGYFPKGTLTSSANPIGVPPGAVIDIQKAPSPTISYKTVNTGGTLVVGGNGFGRSTSIEAGLGSASSLDFGVGTLPSLVSGASSLRALAASAPAVRAADSAPMRIAILKADSKGRLSARLKIPANAVPGRHELYLIGMAPDAAPRLLEVAVTVTAPPILTRVSQSHRRWREGKRLALAARQSRLSIGTVFSLTLNEPAKLSFAFTQPSRGRKAKGRCVARTPSYRHKATCKRTITRGVLSVTGHAGLNRVSFQGRISRRQKLKPGSYTLMLSATGRNGRSAPKTLRFTIVK